MSETILHEILEQKAKELEIAQAKISLDDLKSQATKAPLTVGFANALLTAAPLGIIAEIKRASPSKGVLRADLDPVQTAKEFVAAGATCLSVLTDEKFFQGSLEYLKAIKAACPQTPVLRKDFTTSPYHVWEARAAGADAILLIAAALNEDSLREILTESFQAGLDVLLEVHNEEELLVVYETISMVERSKYANQVVLGINNRDLKTFETDLEVSKQLLSQLKMLKNARGDESATVCVSESGIRTAQDLIALSQSGAQAFLIGESLIAQGNPGENLKKLLEEAKKKLS